MSDATDAADAAAAAVVAEGNRVIDEVLATFREADPPDPVSAFKLADELMDNLPDEKGYGFRALTAVLIARLWAATRA